MPASIILWMTAIQGLIAIAPDVLTFAAKVKAWVKDLFDQGIITEETQNALRERVDTVCAHTLLGEELPHWTVEADPE